MKAGVLKEMSSLCLQRFLGVVAFGDSVVTDPDRAAPGIRSENSDDIPGGRQSATCTRIVALVQGDVSRFSETAAF